MGRYTALLLVALAAVVVVSAQDYQAGLSIHNQQVQEHLRKEAEHLRQYGGSPPQQYNQQQYNQPQHNQYDDNNNYARSNNPQQDYEQGLKAHQQAIQEVLAKEAQFQPQNFLTGENNPAYKQGLAQHQQALQEHLAQERQHGGPGPVYQPQQQTYHQPAPAPAPQYRNSGQNQGYEYGIQLHMQQLAEHARAEQHHQSQVGQATQYHQSQSQYDPPPRSYSNNYQPSANSFQQPTSRNDPYRGGKVTLANLGF